MNKNQVKSGGWVPRRRYPPFCPGTGNECKGIDCEIKAAKDYSWRNVFLSIPFKGYDKRQVLESTLKEHRLFPIIADGKVDGKATGNKYGNTIAQNISGCICSSAHAIMELSVPKRKMTAPGVLSESGFVRTMIPKERLLFIGRRGTKPGVELDGFHRISYDTDQELKDEVDQWLKTAIKRPLNAVRRILLSRVCPRYKICLHCLLPTHARKGTVDAPSSLALSGGGSGSELIRLVFERLIEMEHPKSRHSIEERVLNTEKTRPPDPFNVKSEAKSGNLYLLDAPIARGKRWKHGLNWVTNGVLSEISKQSGPKPSVSFKPLTKGKEEKKIILGAREEWKANRKEDYGVIMRVRNPYSPGAFALILAGIHAPASHAAAEIVVTPTLAQSLLNYVYKGCKLPSELYFAVVFSVRRTYFPDGLGTPKWLYGERLD